MSDESNESPGKAIALINFGILCGVGLDFSGKWLLAHYSLPQFIFLRSLFGAALLMLVVRWFGGLQALKTRKIGWHLLRSLFSVGAMFGFFYGLSKIPLVDAFTIGFVAPLVTTALAAIVLRDPVGWRRWTAVGVGFLGVLVALRPGSGVFSPASLAVIGAATCYACLAITARRMSQTESGFSLSLYVLIGPTLASLFFVEGWLMPQPIHWLGFLFAGLCSAGAWIGIVGAYRRAPPSMLAPFEYTALVWAAIGGYLIWGEVPDGWVVSGGLIIVASGLFIAYREIGGFTAPARYLRAFTSGAAARAAAERKRNS